MSDVGIGQAFPQARFFVRLRVLTSAVGGDRASQQMDGEGGVFWQKV